MTPGLPGGLRNKSQPSTPLKSIRAALKKAKNGDHSDDSYLDIYNLMIQDEKQKYSHKEPSAS